MAAHVDGPGRTFLIYLDTLAEGEGGETNFPHVGHGFKFRPKQGDAITWRTTNWSSRSPSFVEELHEGVAVKSGVKTILIAHYS
jgi:hypothetical protein